MKNQERAWTPEELDLRAQLEAGAAAVVANCSTDHRLIAWAKSDGRFVYCGRFDPRYGSSIWRNPCKMANGKTATSAEREACLVLFRDFLHTDSKSPLSRTDRSIEELRGKVLGCWCRPEPCHCDDYVTLLEGATAAVARPAALSPAGDVSL